MVLDPIFILYWEMGLDGAALGLVLFRFSLMGLALFFAAYQHDLIARPDWAGVSETWRTYMAVALPGIATQMATPAGNYFLTIVMAPFGDDAVAAWAVVGRLTVLAFGGVFALSGATGGSFGQKRQMQRRLHIGQPSLDLCMFFGGQFSHFRIVKHGFGRFKIVQGLRIGTDFFNDWPQLGILAAQLRNVAIALCHLRFDELEPSRNFIQFVQGHHGAGVPISWGLVKRPRFAMVME